MILTLEDGACVGWKEGEELGSLVVGSYDGDEVGSLVDGELVGLIGLADGSPEGTLDG